MPRVRRECSWRLALVFFEPCSNIHCVSSKHNMRCTSKALTKLQRFLPSQWVPFGASKEEALQKPFPGFFFVRVFSLCLYLGSQKALILEIAPCNRRLHYKTTTRVFRATEGLARACHSIIIKDGDNGSSMAPEDEKTFSGLGKGSTRQNTQNLAAMPSQDA